SSSTSQTTADVDVFPSTLAAAPPDAEADSRSPRPDAKHERNAGRCRAEEESACVDVSDAEIGAAAPGDPKRAEGVVVPVSPDDRGTASPCFRHADADAGSLTAGANDECRFAPVRPRP